MLKDSERRASARLRFKPEIQTVNYKSESEVGESRVSRDLNRMIDDSSSEEQVSPYVSVGASEPLPFIKIETDETNKIDDNHDDDYENEDKLRGN